MRIEDQMYFDNGEDSFLAEVIGLVNPTIFAIDFWASDDPARRVSVTLDCIEPATSTASAAVIHIEAFGHSYGEALRHTREVLRDRIGR